MAIQVKICGLSTPDAIDAAVRHGASHVGFVFFPASPRNVTVTDAAKLAERVPSPVSRVGIFVDPSDAFLREAIDAARLAAVQLHGDTITPQRAYSLRRSGVELWKAIPVRTSTDVAKALTYMDAADRIVFDAKTPPGAPLPGGMGLRFDWKLLARHRQKLPWALSGGLDSTNLPEAVNITGARMVDVSSGVESAPGVKDVDKIAAFLHAARSL